VHLGLRRTVHHVVKYACFKIKSKIILSNFIFIYLITIHDLTGLRTRPVNGSHSHTPIILISIKIKSLYVKTELKLFDHGLFYSMY